MKINEIGGEFALIKRICERVSDNDVVVGIGDDTAVIRYKEDKYLLWTTDMLVEEDHFSLRWSSPKHVGIKVIEANVSDIAAMGGLPRYALVSVSLRNDTLVEFVDELYEGMREACKKYDMAIIGGDTTHGSEIVVNVSVIGEVEKDFLSLRSGAKVNDLILVTGDLGKSAAQLALLQNNLKGPVKEHLEPRARLKEARRLVHAGVNAMIDVSDGLASEIKHLCEESNVGAVIYKEKIPVREDTRKIAAMLRKDATDFALYGGEDFELVFTLPKEKLQIVNLLTRVTVVGEVVEKERGISLVEKGKEIRLGEGYEHFK
jgi:thiamine-monophosphate kinase